MPAKSEPQYLEIRDIVICIAVWATLALTYMLTFTGEIGNIDELAMYAGAESLAQGRGYSWPQITFAPYHNPVGLIEPGQSILAVPLYLLAQAFSKVNNIQAVLLLNVIVTASTGALIYITARRLSYSPIVCWGTALTYGLASIAWPYARTFYREPLLALIWLSAVYVFVMWQQRQHFLFLVLCALFLLVSLFIKITAVAAIPFFVISIFLYLPLKYRYPVIIGIVIFGLLIFFIFMLIQSWRFNHQVCSLIQSYILKYPFHKGLLRIYAQLFSPDVGLLFLMPSFPMIIVGSFYLLRKNHHLAIIYIGTLFTMLYLYNQRETWFYLIVWGFRPLVAVIPLLVLSLAEIFSHQNKILKVAGISSSFLTLILQLPVVTSTWHPILGQVTKQSVPKTHPWNLAIWEYSPAFIAIREWQPKWLNLLWFSAKSDGTLVCDPYLAFALGFFLILALIGGIFLVSHPLHCRNSFFIVLMIIFVGITCLAGGLLLYRGYDLTHDYPGMSLSEAQSLAKLISASPNHPKVLVSVSNEFGINFWLGFLKGKFTHYWYSPAQLEGFEPILDSQGENIWLVIDRVHLPPENSGHDLEYWLNSHAYQVDGTWIGGFQIFRYISPKAVSSMQHYATECTFEPGMLLQAFQVAPTIVRRGQALVLEFEFLAQNDINYDYIWFTHLFAEDGHQILGRDGAPLYGAAPTSTWHQGEKVIDRRAIWIPDSAIPGRYTLVAGFVNPDGSRLPVKCSGIPLKEFVTLAKVVVLE